MPTDYAYTRTQCFGTIDTTRHGKQEIQTTLLLEALGNHAQHVRPLQDTIVQVVIAHRHFIDILLQFPIFGFDSVCHGEQFFL